MKKYPDIDVLLKQKAMHRRKMAALPFEEKVKIAFSLSGRHKSIRRKRSIATHARAKGLGRSAA
jgi:hypothetical protein